MKDIERQILQAFLFALAKQDQPLPVSIQKQLNTIAESHTIPESLDNHIADLDNIATTTPSLKTPYQEAHNALTAIASLRAKGVLPDEDDAGPTDQEFDNVMPGDIGPEMARTRELLERIRLDLGQARPILSAKNSVQQAQQTFKP